jgi:hypothetical protein
MQCAIGYLTVGTVPEIVRCTRSPRRRPYGVAPLGANKLLLPWSLLNPAEVWDPHAGSFLWDVIPYSPTDTYRRFGFCEQAFIFPDDRCSRFLWNVCTYLYRHIRQVVIFEICFFTFFHLWTLTAQIDSYVFMWKLFRSNSIGRR